MRRFFWLMMVFLAAGQGQGQGREEKHCVFCEIAAGKSEASFVYKDDRLMAFMDYAPINPGHVLIVPVEHGDDLLDIPEETAREMMALAQRIGAALKKSGLKADAFVVKMNNGEMLASLRHAHLHVYPRYEGDDGEHFPYGREMAERADLEAAAKKIRAALEE